MNVIKKIENFFMQRRIRKLQRPCKRTRDALHTRYGLYR